MFIFNVHFQCSFSMFIFNVHFQCSFSMFIFNVHFQCSFSMFIFNAYFQCLFSMFIFNVHFQCPFSMFISNIHFQCSFSMSHLPSLIYCITNPTSPHNLTRVKVWSRCPNPGGGDFTLWGSSSWGPARRATVHTSRKLIKSSSKIIYYVSRWYRDTATAGSWASVGLVNWDLDLLRYWRDICK
jgi:hypothetical protein